MSITNNEYSIKKLHLVMSSIHKKKKITSNLKGRHSDCFAYIISGTTDYSFTDGQSFQAQANDVLYLAKGSKYVMDILSESYEVVFVDFDFDITHCNKSKIFHPRNHSELKDIFKSIRRKWFLKKPAYYSDCLSSLYKIYTLIIQNEFIPYVPKSKQSALNEVIKIIADNFSDPDLSVSELASVSQMSEGHFRRLFKTIYNVSPVQYIKKVRINYAKTLLELHNHTIDEIAKLSGFANTYYFSRCFKSETEMTPSQYKALHNTIHDF